MPVEFLGMGGTNDGTETHPRTGPTFDKENTLKLARAHEEYGWDRVLTAYSSSSPAPAQAAAWVAARTDTPQLLLAHRPNVSYPTFAAKTFATLDQISEGRLTVHFITGGSTADRAREGDVLVSMRGYDTLNDAIDVGRQVIPAVREEVIKRDRERELASTEVEALQPVVA